MSSPFGPLVVIANPRSGRGKVGAHLVEIERILTEAGLSYRVVRTTHPGHATEAARDALDRGERYLVAAGGDGTVHEVLNGMITDDQPVAGDAVLGVVAAGSGCDFVRSFGLPGDAVEGARHLAGDAVRLIDVAKVTFRSGGGSAPGSRSGSGSGPAEVTRYFANIAEAGLGGAVVDRTLRLPGFLGGASYFCGFWLTLPGFGPRTVRLDADGQEFAGRAFNVVVANCRFYGGGMQISPKSDPCDGALEVLVMTGPKSDAFTTLPKVYRGAHLPHRHIAELRGSRVRVEADPPLPIEADGEILGTTPATFEVIPRAIRVKV
ncbi:MAG: diacylglycerol/lipid kinase family protein [Streptosporangiaceae bacterium]